MKRHIEFRAKVLFTPPGQAPEWVYGHYYEGIINAIIVQRIPHGPTHDDPAGGEYLDTIAVRRETLGQFTGLKDEKGTDIYEGDVVACTVRGAYGKPEISRIRGPVEITPYGTAYATYGAEHCRNVVVIGTIHDDTEYLPTSTDTPVSQEEESSTTGGSQRGDHTQAEK